jgi:hypothetical protein
MSETFSASNSGKTLQFGIALALVLDIPFAAILISIWGAKPDALALLVFLIPVTISGFLIYISFLARKMTYVLREKDLYVDFPISTLQLRYEEIKSAGKVETSLAFRLFGGSWPGVHWGVFTTTNVGNVQAYATRYKGAFILLEVNDGSRVLLSPENPDGFLEALNERTEAVSPELMVSQPLQLDRHFAIGQFAIVSLAWIALLIYILSIYTGLPDIIPVHFGLNGVPNRWGSKNELFLLAGVAAIFPLMNTIFAFKLGRYNRGSSAFLGFVFLLTIGLFALVVNQMVHAI